MDATKCYKHQLRKYLVICTWTNILAFISQHGSHYHYYDAKEDLKIG